MNWISAVKVIWLMKILYFISRQIDKKRLPVFSSQMKKQKRIHRLTLVTHRPWDYFDLGMDRYFNKFHTQLCLKEILYTKKEHTECMTDSCIIKIFHQYKQSIFVEKIAKTWPKHDPNICSKSSKDTNLGTMFFCFFIQFVHSWPKNPTKSCFCLNSSIIKKYQFI